MAIYEVQQEVLVGADYNRTSRARDIPGSRRQHSPCTLYLHSVLTISYACNPARLNL